MALVKATIRAKDGSGELQCAFNPTLYTITKSAEWRGTPIAAAPSAPTPEFVGTKPRNLTMSLLFDAWATGQEDVSQAVSQLLEWTNPTESSISQGRPNPPILAFTWGQSDFFDAYLSNVNAQYTMFRADGSPVRATVGVTLVEVPNEPGRQNPSSGSLAGHRTALLSEGESLHSIAYREYGDPTLWRAIAAANRIDDPLRVDVGAMLFVPPREEALRRG